MMPTEHFRGGGGVVLGIDLGTTNSVMAVVQDGDAEVLTNDVGNRLTPSCVHVVGPARLVGEAALHMAVSDPENTVRNVKGVLGLPAAAVQAEKSRLLGAVRVRNSNDGLGAVLALGERAVLTPEEVAAALLQELKKAAETQLGRCVTKAVIAVPTYFNAAQRHAVRDAGILAGLDVVRLVNEPTAAAMAYAHEQEFHKTVVVVDVGGGGTSISVVRVENNKVRVLASSGQRLPGGEDIDNTMVKHLLEVIRSEQPSAKGDLRFRELLRAHWEKAKMKLSRIPSTRIVTFLSDVGKEFQREVTRADLDRCKPLFQQIADALRDVLEAAKISSEAVDDVLLVGGSTRLHHLRQLVLEAVGVKRLCKAVHPDEDVAKGAALLGAGCFQVEDVTALHLLVMSGGNNIPVYANSILPHKEAVNQGHDAMVRQGHWVVSGSEDMPMADIVELTKKTRTPFSAILLDESGLFAFLDVNGEVLPVVPKGCLSAQKLGELQERSQKHQRDQEAEKDRMEVMNALEEKCRTRIASHVADDSDADLQILREVCKEGLDWLQAHSDASFSEVQGKLREIAVVENDIADTRKSRQEYIRAKSALEDRCLKLVTVGDPDGGEFKQLQKGLTNQQGTDGDQATEDLRLLQKYCRGTLTWLKENTTATLEEIDYRTREIDARKSEINYDRTKNYLSGKCQAVLSKKETDYDLVAEDLKTLQHVCRDTMSWLQSRYPASIEELEMKLRDILAQEHTMNRNQAARSLQDKCNALLRQQVTDGGPSAADLQPLQQLCRDTVSWLQNVPHASIEKLDHRYATLVSAELELQQSPKRQGGVSPRDAQQGDGEPSRPHSSEEAGAGLRTGEQDADRLQAECLLRDMYRRVFTEEELRRRRFSPAQDIQAAGHSSQWLQAHADEVVGALALHAAQEALREAREAGAAALLVEAVEVGDEARLALSLRYVRGEAVRAPVERLLLLADAYTTTGADLLRRVIEMCAGGDPAWLTNLHGVSWDNGTGAVSTVAEELLGLLRDKAAGRRTDGGPHRLWAGNHNLERRVADACAEKHAEALEFFEDVDAIRELFCGSRFAVLRRYCPAVRPEDWVSVRGVVLELVRRGGVENVSKALRHLRRLSDSSLARTNIDFLLDDMQDSKFFACALVFHSVFARVLKVAPLLSSTEPWVPDVIADLGVPAVKLRSATFKYPRLRYESARWLSKLAVRLHDTARAAVEDIVQDCARPLWLMHALATGHDAEHPLLQSVPVEERHRVLGDLRRMRDCRLLGTGTDPVELLRSLPTDRFRFRFPDLERALVSLLTAPLLPCGQGGHRDGQAGGGRSVDELRNSVRCAGSCPHELLEPVMVLLSSTGWSAAYDRQKDLSAVLEALAPTIQKHADK